MNNSGATSQGINSWLNGVPNPSLTSVPKAYINWILLDDQFKAVSSGSGFDLINTNADAVKSHQRTVSIGKSGYLYVYCSNESNVDVFFDNLQLVHTGGPLLQTANYYPFGLTMSGISSKAAGSLENRKKYNGIEFDDDLDINTCEAFYRNLDPQIGRWWQIDPKCEVGINPDIEDEDELGLESLSPYNSMGNDPVKYTDPKGDIFGIDNLIGAVVGATVEFGTQVVTNMANGQSFSNAVKSVNLPSVAIAAVAGAITSGVSVVAGKGLVQLAAKEFAVSAVDAVESAAKQYVQTGKVSLAKVGTDVVSSKVGGLVTGKVNSYAIKTSEKQLDRVVKIATRDATSTGRKAAVEKALTKAAVKMAPQKAAGGASSNVLQASADKINGSTKKD